MKNNKLKFQNIAYNFKGALIAIFYLIASFFYIPTFGQIIIEKPFKNAVFQRNYNNLALIPIKGTVSVEATEVEARLIPFTHGQGIETEWQQLSVSSGRFQGKINGSGGFYKLLIRCKNQGIIISDSELSPVGIGDNFMVAGQSNTMVDGAFATDERVIAVNYAQFSSENPTFINLKEGFQKWLYPSNSVRAFIGSLGDLLVKKNNVPVMFMCAGAGGTNSGNWSNSTEDYSQPYQNLRVGLNQYSREYGIKAILWHQGETNSVFELYPSAQYYKDLKKVIEKTRFDMSFGKLAWMVANVSWAKNDMKEPNEKQDGNKPEFRAETIKGQNLVIDNVPDVFRGPNSDLLEGYIGSELRYDGVHLSILGQTKLAELWNNAMDYNFYQNSLAFIPESSNLAPQSIQVENVDEKTVASPDFYINASSTSGLPLSFSLLSGPARLDGNKVILNGTPGNVIININQFGNSEFTKAATGIINFEVKKIKQNINFQQIENKKVDSPPISIIASSSSGLLVSFELISGPATLQNNQIILTKKAGKVVLLAKQLGTEVYESALSVEISFDVLKLTQSLNKENIANKYVNDPPFLLTATSSVGLPIIYKLVEGPAIIEKNKITLTKQKGHIIIEESQPGNESYEAAVSLNIEFDILKYKQEINITPVESKTVKDTLININATSTSGLPLTYKVLSGPALINNSKIVLQKKEGTVVIEVSQIGDEIFEPISKSITFDVKKLNQQITFPNILSQVYSTTKVPLAATSSSGLKITYSVVSGNATIDNGIITIIKPSKITIKANQIGDEIYYKADSISISFEVFKLTQSISFSPIGLVFTTSEAFKVLAKSTSNLPISYKVAEGPVKLVNDLVTLNGIAGKVIINAIQIGDDFYEKASQSIQFQINTLVAIEPSSRFFASVSPNPANDFINLELKSNIKTIALFNILGNEMPIKIFSKSINNLQIATINLPEGIYFLKIMHKNNLEQTLKVLIQH